MKKQIEPRICLNCGKEFIPTRIDKKCCTRRCNKRKNYIKYYNKIKNDEVKWNLKKTKINEWYHKNKEYMRTYYLNKKNKLNKNENENEKEKTNN
jgi:hypothetical protein